MREFNPINVVCFGGGTGLPSLLSGLKHNPWLNITAVVNMFDTGGSSGELKDRFGILPPGDILKCILALSKDEDSARKILLKRISNDSCSIHNAGNILLKGFEDVYGDLDTAIDALGQILDINGTVLPVTVEHGTLIAKYYNGSEHKGETSVDLGVYEGLVVERLSLHPKVAANPKVVEAINQAQVICIGPGSFYTSVLPNFLPEGIAESIGKSFAPILFISNLLTEGWGMKSFNIQSIVETLESYLPKRQVSKVIANRMVPNKQLLSGYLNERKLPIKLDCDDDFRNRLVAANLWEDPLIARHDSAKLAHLVSTIIDRMIVL